MLEVSYPKAAELATIRDDVKNRLPGGRGEFRHLARRDDRLPVKTGMSSAQLSGNHHGQAESA